MQGFTTLHCVTACNNKFNIKETTVRLSRLYPKWLGDSTIAHLPAIYLTKDKVAETIADLDKVGVEILALLVDIIRSASQKVRYATDLIEFIKGQAPLFEIIGACYPEGHPDSPNQISDIQNLKKKSRCRLFKSCHSAFLWQWAFYDFQDTNAPLAGIDVSSMQESCQLESKLSASVLKTCENIHLPT